MTKSLLPPNATDLERASEAAIGDRLDTLAPDGIRTINDPKNCPEAALPYLGRERSVDVYDPAWSTDTKRNVVDNAFAVHRIKGTPKSVVNVLKSMGITASVMERVAARKYDGKQTHNGLVLYGATDGWAMYRILLSSPLRNDQVSVVRRVTESTAPTGTELVSMEYREVANLYDARSTYDGAYNHGSAK